MTTDLLTTLMSLDADSLAVGAVMIRPIVRTAAGGVRGLPRPASSTRPWYCVALPFLCR